VQALAGLPTVALLGEGPDHLAVLSGLMSSGVVRGTQVHDARIAAICLAHGVRELWTADRDFTYFPPLKTRNPLVS
jgi:predicted nucleic acid-binding protein